MKDTILGEKATSVQEQLAVTIQFLANSFASLQYLFKISKQSISIIIPEVCNSFVEGLKEHIEVRNMYLLKKLKKEIKTENNFNFQNLDQTCQE